MDNRIDRIGAYLLQRAQEPSTWSGLTLVATLIGWNIAPEKSEAIVTVGTLVASLLLGATREGRNKPDNPTFGTVMRGELPPQKEPIVPPTPVAELDATKVAAKDVKVTASGEVVADPPK